MPISRRLLTLAVGGRLVGVTNATGYIGQIGAQNGLPGISNTPADPPTKGNGDPRVRPYFILEPQAGTSTSEADLADTYVDLDWPFTVRAVAGDVHDLLALTDRIDALLWRWSPGEISGAQTGRVSRQPGYDPLVLPDRTVTPPRHFTPLQYRLTAHT